MQRIDANTVELTEKEVAAKELFESMLDIGYTIKDAAGIVEKTFTITDEFYEYLIT